MFGRLRLDRRALLAGGVCGAGGLSGYCVASASGSERRPSGRRVDLVRLAAGGWVWREGAIVVPMRQGVAYQPTEGERHIHHDYIAPRRLDQLVAQLCTEAELVRLRANHPGLQGVGRGHGETLKRLGFTVLRLYSPPVGDDGEAARFSAVLRRALELYGLRVYLSDDLGLYDPAHSLDRTWMEQRLAEIASRYAAEPWLAALSLGNENERFIRGGDGGDVKLNIEPDAYYRLMDALAGQFSQAAARAGASIPVFLGHGHPRDPAYSAFEGLANLTGVGFNLYTSKAGLVEVGRRMEVVNSRRQARGLSALAAYIAEFGQSARQVRSMTPRQRADDFREQLTTLDAMPGVAGRCAFEFTSELWKKREEGEGADLFGILGQPDVERVFADAARAASPGG